MGRRAGGAIAERLPGEVAQGYAIVKHWPPSAALIQSYSDALDAGTDWKIPCPG
jgi:hypothetical protein